MAQGVSELPVALVHFRSEVAKFSHANLYELHQARVSIWIAHPLVLDALVCVGCWKLSFGASGQEQVTPEAIGA